MEHLVETLVGLLVALQTWDGGKWAYTKLFIDRVPRSDRDWWQNECKKAMDERSKFSRERYEQSVRIEELEKKLAKYESTQS